MTDSTDDDLSLQPMNPTRRSVSVGDSPFESQEHISTQNEACQDSNGYICAPLSRTDHPSTAKTCWLVVVSCLSKICAYISLG